MPEDIPPLPPLPPGPPFLPPLEGGGEPLAGFPTVSGGTSGLLGSWETAVFLKRRHEREIQRWTAALASKEEALSGTRERAAMLESEMREMVRSLQAAENKSLADAIESQAKLEAAFKEFSADRKKWEEENAALKALLDQTRKRLWAAEARHKEGEKSWIEREEEFARRGIELEGELASRRERASALEDKARELSKSLDEAKGAIEKTLAELLRERQVRAQAEEERNNALKKVGDLEGHVEQLSKIWESERAEWRELWERERSSWQDKKRELESWEGRVRTEREAWQAEMGSRQQAQARFAAQISESMRQAAEASSLVSKLLRVLGVRAPEALPGAGAALKARSRRLRRAGLAILAAAAIAGLGVFIKGKLGQLRLKPLAAVPISAELLNPSALGFDGSLLWVGQWDGRYLALDPKSPGVPVLSSQVKGQGPFHPAAIAFGPGRLWSLDAGQGRLITQEMINPSRVLKAAPAPGAAPSALAFDGSSLWVYDASSRALYRRERGEWTPYGLDSGAFPSALGFAAGRLWAYDPQKEKIFLYRFQSGSWHLAQVRPLKDAGNVHGLALQPLGKRGSGLLWVLAESGGRYALKRYAFSPYF